MAKIKKLPSGSYRMQVQKNGIRKSFTASTKNQVILQAAKWLNDFSIAKDKIDLQDAIENYIEKNKDILSPSTIRGYVISLNRIKKYEISKKKIDSITSDDLQTFIKLLNNAYSPKTVKNTYGLITSIFAFEGILVPKGINLPPTQKKTYQLPSRKGLQAIISECEDISLKIAIMLASYCGLRRSEIVALTSDDLEKNILHIHSAMVKGADKQFYIKSTKTKSSTRQVIVPNFILKEIKKIEGRLVPLTPAALTKKWEVLRKKYNLETRFHDLRHYSASLMHAEGVPDQYIMQKHGWKTDYALKNIYRNEIDEYTISINKKFNQLIEEDFE